MISSSSTLCSSIKVRWPTSRISHVSLSVMVSKVFCRALLRTRSNCLSRSDLGEAFCRVMGFIPNSESDSPFSIVVGVRVCFCVCGSLDQEDSGSCQCCWIVFDFSFVFLPLYINSVCSWGSRQGAGHAEVAVFRQDSGIEGCRFPVYVER